MISYVGLDIVVKQSNRFNEEEHYKIFCMEVCVCAN